MTEHDQHNHPSPEEVRRELGRLEAQATQLIERGRLYVRLKEPYLAPVVYRMRFVADYTVPTMQTTKQLVTRYNPRWVAQTKNKDEFIGFIIAHESHHFLRDTFGRSIGKDPTIANWAADYAINSSQKTSGWTPPPDGLFPDREDPPMPECLAMEAYYNILLERLDQGKAPPALVAQLALRNQGGGEGETEGGEGEDPSTAKGPGPGSGCCGTVASGKEDQDGLTAEQREVEQNLGLDPVSLDALRMQTAEQIKKYAAQGRGKVPAALLDWAQDPIVKSRIRWDREVLRIVRRKTGIIEVGGGDYSLRRPNRKALPRGLMIAGTVDQKVMPALILDTSGSMGTEQLDMARTQMAGIMEKLGCDQVLFMEADCAITVKPQLISTKHLRNLPIAGRGGTDFTAPLEYLDNMRNPPDIVIYLTDGDGYCDYRPKNFEVIWCIVPSYFNRPPVNWGHVVLIRKDGERETNYPNFPGR